MKLPSTYELALVLAELLGTGEADGFEKSTHRRAIQRAVQSPDAESPGADNLLGAIDRLTAALGYAISPDEATDPADSTGATVSVGRRTAIRALHESSVLYGRLRFHLDLQTCSPSHARRLVLWRFAVPFLGVTLGEHLEGCAAGVDLARVPSAPFRPFADGRPTAFVFDGLLKRSEASTLNELARLIHWPYEVPRLYEWSDLHGEAGPISRTKIDEVCEIVSESGVLGADGGFGGRGPFRLDRTAETSEQAVAAAEYLLSLEKPQAAAASVRTSVASLRRAASGEGTWEYHLRLAILTDLLYRPWGPEDLRHELLAARALEKLSSASSKLEANDEPGGSLSVASLPDRVAEVALYTAGVWRRLRYDLRDQFGFEKLADAERWLNPGLVMFAVLDARPITPDALVTYDLLFPMYWGIEHFLVPAITGSNDVRGNGTETLRRAFDPASWSKALQRGFILTNPSRPKKPGGAHQAGRLLHAPPGTDPPSAWHLVRGRLHAQSGRPSSALEAFSRSVREGRATPGYATLAAAEGLVTAAAAGDWKTARRLHKLAVRYDVLAMKWNELDAILNAPSPEERFREAFPYSFPK